MRIVLKFLKWTGITLGVLFALYLGINAFDETLDPGAAAIINSQAKIKPEENAYFFAVGLRAPLDRAPGEFGQECVARLIKISSSEKEMVSSGKTGCDIHESALVWQGSSTISCGRQQAPCLAHFQKQNAEIKLLAEKNEIFLQRYERLLAMEHFEDVPYTSHMTVPQPLDLTNELYSAISAIKLQEGDVGAFIQRIAGEAKFQRMVLRGNSSFTSKLIALSGVFRAANLASAAVQNQPALAREHYAALLNITQPLTIAERNFESVMVGELRGIALASTLSFGDANEDGSLFSRLSTNFALKNNATLNLYYRNLSAWRDLLQLPTEQYPAAEEAVLDRLTNPWRDGYVHMIYNPVGKFLLRYSSPKYATYPRRIIDFDGRLRLFSLQIQIAAQGIPESDIPAFLRNVDPQFRDPYTGQPMQWDKTRGLHFKGHGKGTQGQDGFISVKL